ncbi:MAG: protein translocase subunit SecDF [Bacteroidetes bacterium]|nr:protein translocase subunit SecDF [Bacteroidota bacterium]
MQGKGLVLFFLVALVAVCVYQLSFTFIAAFVESDAVEYSIEMVPGDIDDPVIKTNRKKVERKYLDSMTSVIVFNLGIVDFTYLECKEQQINLGLDLQGGMNVILQVSVEGVIKGMTHTPEDPKLIAALKMATEMEKTDQRDFVTLFGEAYEKQQPGSRLISLFAAREYQDKIPGFPDSKNDVVLEFIRETAEESIGRTFNILRTRIDKFGVTQPNITLQEGTGRIIVELPGVDEPERVRKLLQATAELGFWETWENPELVQNISDANEALKDVLDLNRKDEEEPPAISSGTDTIAKTDVEQEGAPEIAAPESHEEPGLLAEAEPVETNPLLLLSDDTDTTGSALFDETDQVEPLYDVLIPNYQQNEDGQSRWSDGPVIGFAYLDDTSTIMDYLSMPELRSKFPPNIKFIWDFKTFPDNEGKPLLSLYALKTQVTSKRAHLEGDAISDAWQDIDLRGNPEVRMMMNAPGAKKWKLMTNKNTEKFVAIVLDDVVYSAPRVQGEIPNGSSSISGSFDIKEAQDLATILKAGKLPAPARIVQEAVVGPSLGQEAIDAGLQSLIAGLILVLLFMIFYYSGGGIVSDLALISNLFFIMGVLASLGATLTLPGMAGIVLTIGMAVDANVIIFERIREELLKGKGLRLAIVDGYSHSYSAILDANITTLITALILAYFGMGAILGFATVLIIGIISSLFTAILLTRLMLDAYTEKDKTIAFYTGLTKGAFKNININFIKLRKVAYVTSSLVIAIGIFSITTRGFDLGVDFLGGWDYLVRFDDKVSTVDIRNSLEPGFEGYPEVKTFGTENQVKITTSYLIDDNTPEAAAKVEAKLFDGLKPYLADGVSFETFSKENKIGSQRIGPTIADEIKTGAIKATIMALIGIFLYILLRFRKWQYGLGAVTALVHNVLILLTVFSIFPPLMPFSMEINQAFIAALLTVIGYSINDTVVVFDRIREYLSLHHTKDMKTTINMAINSTLSRTLITSFTTLMVVFILFLFGGEMIKGFSFALLIGILVGTYSSIFIATPIVVDLSKKEGEKKA